MSNYVTEAEMRAYLGDDTTLDASALVAALDAAEAEIDQICDRTFTQAGSASARKFMVSDTCKWVQVDDISTTSGLIVQTDPGGDGTFESTWTSADYQLEPLNGVSAGSSGWPYTKIRAVGSLYFYRPWNDAASVQVTAKWGWAAVPEPVKMATKILAKENYQSKDLRGGTVGFGDYGAVRARDTDRFSKLITPYVRRSVLVG